MGLWSGKRKGGEPFREVGALLCPPCTVAPVGHHVPKTGRVEERGPGLEVALYQPLSPAPSGLVCPSPHSPSPPPGSCSGLLLSCWTPTPAFCWPLFTSSQGPRGIYPHLALTLPLPCSHTSHGSPVPLHKVPAPRPGLSRWPVNSSPGPSHLVPALSLLCTPRPLTVGVHLWASLPPLGSPESLTTGYTQEGIIST